VTHRRFPLFVCVLLLVHVFEGMSALHGEDWPKYKRDLANTGHSAEWGISSANVAQLKTKWTFQVPGGAYISDSPAIVTFNGTPHAFIGAWNGVFYALNAVTGKQIWSFTVDMVQGCNTKRGCHIGSSPTVDKANNLVFFGAGNGYIYALRATTGKLVWKVQAGIGAGSEIWSSPVLYNGNIYVGVASHGDVPCVIGQVDAYNELTGSQAWNFTTIDQSTCPSGQCVGAAVWATVAVDDTNGIIYAATGNPGDTCVPSTQNAALYPDSVLAFNATTGSLLNYFQAKSDDDNDDDFGASPILHTSGEDNECTSDNTSDDWLTAINKYGEVFTLGRDANGLNGSVSKLSVPFGFIATPSLLPQTQTKQCGSGKQIINHVNYIYAPSSKGALLTFFQTQVGAVRLQQKNTISTERLLAAPAVIRDIAIFGGNDGKLTVAKTDGTTLMQFPIGAAIYGGVAISNGRIYFGAINGVFYCMSIDGK
jgi:outer membrane protein assembly factor BamB